MSLTAIDDATERVVAALVSAYGATLWDSLLYVCRWNQTRNAGSDDSWVTYRGTTQKQYPEADEQGDLSEATRAHLALLKSLGQPSWSMMVVRVDRSGKYGVEFDYREYVEHDLSRYNVELIDGKPTLVRNRHFREEWVNSTDSS